MEINLKRDVKLYQSPAYTIPQAFLQLAKTEIVDLVEKGVLLKGIESSWKSPSFFRKKKDGGIRFVSDLQKLNEAIERDASPLPVIDDVIWKMDGFTYATYLDLNKGYYHFVLSEDSRKLLGIILPWGNIARHVCLKV